MTTIPPSNEKKTEPQRLYVATGLVRHILRGKATVRPCGQVLSLGFTICGREALRPSGWYVAVNAIGPVCENCEKMIGTSADVDTRPARP